MVESQQRVDKYSRVDFYLWTANRYGWFIPGADTTQSNVAPHLHTRTHTPTQLPQQMARHPPAAARRGGDRARGRLHPRDAQQRPPLGLHCRADAALRDAVQLGVELVDTEPGGGGDEPQLRGGVYTIGFASKTPIPSDRHPPPPTTTTPISKQRADEYCRTEQEAAESNPAYAPPSDAWPDKGDVRVEHLTLRYPSAATCVACVLIWPYRPYVDHPPSKPADVTLTIT